MASATCLDSTGAACGRVVPAATSLWTEASLSRSEEVIPLMEAVVRQMDEHGYNPRDRHHLRLGLEEAVVNALRHGNGGDPRKRVVVSYYVCSAAVLAEVKDAGPGFDPGAVPDPTADANLDKPGGRGLLLMRRLLSRVCFRGRGNRVLLCKYPSAPAT